MKIFHTGVPSFYPNGTPDETGVYTPNFTSRWLRPPQASHDNDQNHNQSIDSYTAIYHSSWCKRQEIAIACYRPTGLYSSDAAFEVLHCETLRPIGLNKSSHKSSAIAFGDLHCEMLRPVGLNKSSQKSSAIAFGGAA